MIPDADIDYEHLSNFELIGKGIFGVVYKASYLGTDVAVKECFSTIKQYGFDFEKVFNREVSILKECRHPNIVQYMGTCIHEDKFYIITEYVKNDNLKTWITERIDEFPWKLRVNFAIDIARALAYLHSRNIMHRDIKPENILITENGRAKICDFGFSRFSAKTEEEKRRLSYCGTETYMAPEIILCMDFNESIDIFGFGIILCEMIAGKLAEKAYKRKIPGFEIDPEDVYRYAEEDPQCPKEFVELAISCTKYEEKERPSWKTVITKLNEIDETIENSYNIGIIPAAGLISNDFLIPLSPAIKGQVVDYNGSPIKKANSVKSLNIDTEELKKRNKKKYNGRPTSPVLNTRRMSNQYYYYYAINNPSNSEDSNSTFSPVYRRLPVYITPSLEHSSIIAVPKDIPKLTLSSPELNPIDLTKKTEQNIIISTEENNIEGEPPVEDQEIDEEDNLNTSNKDPMDSMDMSSLNLNSSFSSNEPSFSSQSNNYNYLKNYAIINNVDNILKNQTYNNIVLDKDKSRSTVDMKNKIKLDSSKSTNKTATKKATNKSKLHAQFILDEEEEEEEEAYENSTHKNTELNKIGKHKSFTSLAYNIRLYPSPFQKRKESLSTKDKSQGLTNKLSLPSDNDETLTVSDNSNKNDKIQASASSVSLTPTNFSSTIEDIYNSEKESITGIHHRFSINNVPTLSKCNVCRRRMSLVKRYLVCDDCSFRCHAKCSSLAPFSCTCTNRKRE